MSGTSRVAIDRLRNTYLIPRKHRTPAAVRTRLDGIVHDVVPAAVRWACSHALEPDDERVWLVRRLDLSLTLNTDAENALLVSAWAGQLAKSLAGLFAAGPDDDNVVVFPSRDVFLARYVADRATGSTKRWWYAEFESLAPLPAGAAIREALARDPSRTTAVLRQLAGERALESVLGVLTAQDARTIWAQLAPATIAPDVSAAAFECLLAAWPRAGLRTGGDHALAANAIRLFATTSAGSVPTSELHHGVELLLAAADVDTPSKLEAVVPDRRIREELRRLTTPERRASVRVVGEEPRPVHSPFAGLFLAWAAFSSSGLSAICRRPAFRYLVALKLLGRLRVVESWQDITPLVAAGLDRSPSAGEWRAFADSGERAELAHALIGWFGRRRPTCGYRVAVERVGEVLLFRDTTTGDWLHAVLAPDGADPTDATDPIREGAALIERATGEPCALVSSEAVSHSAAADLAYFTLAGCGLPPGVDAATDLLGTLAARAAVRAFAARLRGFAAASAEHLYRNFLAGGGEIRITGGQVSVRLDPPPLHVVLRIGGHDDATFTLPDGRRAGVTVTPD